MVGNFTWDFRSYVPEFCVGPNTIETQYNILKNSITSNEKIIPMEIKYIDRKNGEASWQRSILQGFSIKGREYKSEREFRLLVFQPNCIPNLLANNPKNMTEVYQPYIKNPTIKCEVNLSDLISKIHISPYVPKWYKGFITGITQKYGLNVPIEQVEL